LVGGETGAVGATGITAVGARPGQWEQLVSLLLGRGWDIGSNWYHCCWGEAGTMGAMGKPWATGVSLETGDDGVFGAYRWNALITERTRRYGCHGFLLNLIVIFLGDVTICWKMPAFGSRAFLSHDTRHSHIHTYAPLVHKNLVTFTLIIQALSIGLNGM
jgi:hypothetical protein